MSNISIPEFKPHINILATLSDKSNVIVSILTKSDQDEIHMGIMRSKLGEIPLYIKTSSTKIKAIIAVLRKKYENLFKEIPLNVLDEKKIKEESKNSLPYDLLQLDSKIKLRNYKFGVIYCKDGQSVKESFKNNRMSIAFQKFLRCLGEKVRLKGFFGFKGDLDVKQGSLTGRHSYYTKWEGFEIMYHVCPMIPPKQRKRLIGNDIVVIVFVEGGIWTPTIRSQVLHAQIVVQPINFSDGTVRYFVSTATKIGVPPTRPRLTGRLFELNDEFKDYILTKCVNLERSSYHCERSKGSNSRSLQELLWYTIDGQLNFLADRYIKYTKQY